MIAVTGLLEGSTPSLRYHWPLTPAPSLCDDSPVGSVCAGVREPSPYSALSLRQVHVEFDTSSSKVKIEGPKEDVEKARERIAARAKELEDSMLVEELDIPTKYHKHIIGKAGANINRSVRDGGSAYGPACRRLLIACLWGEDWYCHGVELTW